jgi:heptose I phosphotransferase
MARAARRALILQLADLVRRLHGAGLFHRDLYLAHIFIGPDVDGPPQLFLIDLQRVVAPRWRRWRWMIKDLAALNFSSAQAGVPGAERLRWLRHYLGVRRLRAEDRRLVRAVAAKSARMARHSARHGL